VPELKCKLCGRTEEVPDWHPSVIHGATGEEAHAYICSQCQDRVRAEALRKHSARSPSGSEA
jgi:uncharacterized protein YlaI